MFTAPPEDKSVIPNSDSNFPEVLEVSVRDINYLNYWFLINNNQYKLLYTFNTISKKLTKRKPSEQYTFGVWNAGVLCKDNTKRMTMGDFIAKYPEVIDHGIVQS